MVKYAPRRSRALPDEMEVFAKFVAKIDREPSTLSSNGHFNGAPLTDAIELLKKSGEKFEFPVRYG